MLLHPADSIYKLSRRREQNLHLEIIHTLGPLHVDVGPMLHQVSEARGRVRGAQGGQDHVNRAATLAITAVDPLQPGLQQELNGGQLAIKAGHVECWQTLKDDKIKHKVC